MSDARPTPEQIAAAQSLLDGTAYLTPAEKEQRRAKAQADAQAAQDAADAEAGRKAAEAKQKRLEHVLSQDWEGALVARKDWLKVMNVAPDSGPHDNGLLLHKQAIEAELREIQETLDGMAEARKRQGRANG